MPSIGQVSFAKGEIGAELYGRTDTSAYQVALKVGLNGFVRSSGGFERRNGLKFISPVKDHSYTPRLVDFQFNTADTHVLEFGNLYMRVYRNDVLVTEAPKAVTGVTKANPGVITVVGHGYTAGQDVYLAGLGGMNELNGRWIKVGTVLSADTFNIADQVDGSNVNTTAFTTYTSGGTAARAYTLVTPYATADLFELNWVQSADVLTVVHRNYPPKEIKRLGLTNWTITDITFAPSIAAPAVPTITVNSAGSTAYSYVVTAINAVGEESIGSPEATGTCNATVDNTVTITAVSGAVSYNVYRKGAGKHGFIGSTTSLTFADKNIKPDESDTPPASRNPFGSAGNYPSSVNYYEQRRVFGGTANAPDTSEYSRVAAYSNMSKSEPVRDDDSITATLTSQRVNSIRHYVPGNDMLILTAGAEWRVNSGDGAFSASTLRQKPQSTWGSSWKRPITIGGTTLYVPDSNNRVRSLGFSLQIDGYTGTDLNLLAPHLFKVYGISDWAAAKYPDTIVHAVRSDGVVCALTFQQEQEVIAWTRWATDGKFRAVACVARATDEAFERTYFVVQRIINGKTVRYVERLKAQAVVDVRDCFYVDCGATYDVPIAITGVSLASPGVVTAPAHGLANNDIVDLSDIVWDPTYDDIFGAINPDQLNGRRVKVANATTNTFTMVDDQGVAVDTSAYRAYIEGGFVRKTVQTLSGLHHLEGRSCVALVDGSVAEALVVANGSVTLPNRASRIHIGLRYISDLETLDKATTQAVIEGKKKSVGRLAFRTQDTRGVLYGPSFSPKKMDEIKDRDTENYDEPTRLRTEIRTVVCPPSWNDHGRICFRQYNPLPMTILGIIPNYTLEDGELRGD